ncbi:MAG: arginine--tRNA ligase, partial [Nanoarchaeota archaeon]|nr:arginine--tRNA ligase [Nanoarchaeota archaeon]
VYNDKMKKVIKELDEKKLTRKSEGAKIVSLKKDKLGVVLIEKSDGSTLYSTRDLASAIDRYKKYKFDIMIYEVGQEQKLHFKQLFKVLEKMGYEWSKNCKHIDHGLYLGKDGKKLATRKGKTVFMEDILNETEELAKIQIKKRFPKISKKELNERAKKVSKAAIFYGDLKNNRANNIIFDLERFVSFEGDTGPYIQYAYARASSILRKIEKVPELILPKELEEKENILIKKLSEFEQIAFEAYKQMNPALIAGYAYKLSQIFNEFYHACPVIGSESESFRLELIKIFRQVLKNSLYLLGIEVMEVM